ncbi:hypothetical protein [Sinomonas gamaensis]|uniref:hypothetical protein n=1 Tax=Sinomonas gamaensis TaxID=2565624 RepID=UPI0011096316|nr:hypothetical protein [Sinomonas gamaensis]
MKNPVGIAVVVAVASYIAAHLVTNGSSDPALLAWGACGVFGVVFGLATVGRLKLSSRRRP